jgi:glutamyl-tRNA synthetase
MTVVTRFAPSPTGYLHVGGARTALFNYLFAHHHGGDFKLRIEDTDADRNTPDAVKAIFTGLSWLRIDHVGEAVFQSKNRSRHMDVAIELVKRGAAYFDYTTPEELEYLKVEWRKSNPKAPFRHLDNYWRDNTCSGFDKDGVAIPSVIRLKAPREGVTVIEDAVQGRVEVQNSTLDDMVLMRSDLTPTYMLAVVVDDHDMGVTHVIRGDDHLNNAFRQLPIYRAMGWPEPIYAHIPLIFDEQGKKYSKRSGAVAVSDFNDLGILSEAMVNYLVRLGWGHGDDEIMSRAQMIDWFDLPGVNRAPSRFDMKKLMSLNEHYLRGMTDHNIYWKMTKGLFAESIDGKAVLNLPSQEVEAMLIAAIPSLKPRCSTIPEMVEMARFYVERPTVHVDHDFNGILAAFPEVWERNAIEQAFRDLSENTGVKLKDIVAPLRLAITGSKVSPPLFEAMELLGREEVMTRLVGSK